MNSNVSNDWLDLLVTQVKQQHPEGEIIVSSGHSPSGTYHIGTLREIMTANAITWALRRAGRKARHIDFVDNFDAFRKVPKFVPEAWSEYLGQPLAVVPDPFECAHESYGVHFYVQLRAGLDQLGVMPDETVFGYETYRNGLLKDQVVAALDQLDNVRTIITEVGGRKLDESWAPVQILDEQRNLRTLKYAGWDRDRRLVTWRNADGQTGTVGLDEGRVKLDWRLDWPARWAKWGVQVEPFGRDHATKGGSYDTGAVLVHEIFRAQAPYPVPYEFINTVGETKKMSKSTGNVLTPADALDVMPPEILRYFVIKARPSRTLNFDSGLGLYTLIDEFSKAAAADDSAAMAYARAGSREELIAHVPFNHLVAVFQTAQGDVHVVRDILDRTGYDDVVAKEWPIVERELEFVKNWLAKYAPEHVKFAVAEHLPDVILSDGQRTFLGKLAQTIRAEKTLNGQGMHDAIYAAAEVAGIKPGEAFAAVYRALLGQDSGPKAGWFLASLDAGFVAERFEAAASAEAAAKAPSEAALPDGRTFRIDPLVAKAFPDAAIGYLVADLTVRPSRADRLPAAQSALEARGVTRENLPEQAEIKAWRSAYKGFGVKPSDYRCSVEALTRRVLDGKPAAVNEIVDLYNYVSVAYGLPMGAMDLDQVQGDIVLRYGKDGETAALMGVEKPVPVTARQVVYADDARIITWLWNYRDARETAVTLETKRAVFFIDSLQGEKAVGPALAELAALLADEAGATVLASGIISA